MTASKGQRALLRDVLGVTFNQAATVYGDRVALFVLGLTDACGFAVAQLVREKVQGPDPTTLRSRSLAQGIRAPVMLGSAAVETLARIVEGFDLGKLEDGLLLGWTVREVHAVGGVPVLVVTGGVRKRRAPSLSCSAIVLNFVPRKPF
jgi:hypothetical protein